MSENTFTPEQEAAIFFPRVQLGEHQQNVLVSASAGSGKTFVMAHRIVEKVKAGVPITQLFISTFTRKAAGELRVRIEQELKIAGRIARDEGDMTSLSSIRASLCDLPHAAIGTMDAFSQQLLREHFNVVHVDPNFRVLADEAERKILKHDVFETLVEAILTGNEAEALSKEAFEKLAQNFSHERSLKAFEAVVSDCYEFAQATEAPLDWLHHSFMRGFETYQRFEDLPIKEPENVKESLTDFFSLLQQGLEEEVFAKATKRQREEDKLSTREKVQIWLGNAEELDKLWLEHRYVDFSGLILELMNDSDTKLTGNNFSGKKTKELGVAEAFQKAIGSASTPGFVRMFADTMKHAQTIERFHEAAKTLTKHLQTFLILFYKRLMARKMQENAYEYNDIAHFAIEILSNETIATVYQAAYQEIMIDEYQDTSGVQEGILQRLSTGCNLFMVGDIKQSIYGFRQADPSLFMQKYRAYREGEENGKLIRLTKNFRSRPEILAFTNEVFAPLMDDFDGMIYGDEEKFQDFPKNSNPTFLPEFLLYRSDSFDSTEANEGADPLMVEEDESLSADKTEEMLTDGEIHLAAEEIQKLLTRKENPVSPSDIVLLVRSKSNNLKIERILTSAGIPVVLDETPQNYLKSMEVMVMLEVLRALDNPLYDTSLVALLRSPLFFFNEDELTKIALQSEEKGSHFWDKIQSVKTAPSVLIDDFLINKVDRFLDSFTAWRQAVNECTIHDLLQQIYRETYYPEYVGALPNGALRQANLQALSSRAQMYEAAGYKGLFQFITLIDTFMAQENDLTSVNVKLPQDAVRVMTIHRSKGLEFDYVFIMSMQARFNTKDLKKSVILSKALGAGMSYIADLKDNQDAQYDFPFALARIDTLPLIANRQQQETKTIAEEMRMLYVAMTRAAKKLYMIGKAKENFSEALSDGRLDTKGHLNHAIRQSAKGFQHWILGLSEAGALQSFVLKTDLRPQLNLENTRPKPQFNQLLKASAQFDGLMSQTDDIQKAKQIMEASYAYKAATKALSVRTPSQLEGRFARMIDTDQISVDKEQSQALQSSLQQSLQLPAFSLSALTTDSEQAPNAAEIGTAIHRLMEAVDFRQPCLPTFQEVLDHLDFPPLLKKYIPLERLLMLFDTPLGQLLTKHADKVYKERAYAMVRADAVSGEEIISRGIIDGFVKFDDADGNTERLILFDYKTNHFKKASEMARIKELYRSQQQLYAEALEAAYGLPCEEIEKYLILFGGPDKVEIIEI